MSESDERFVSVSYLHIYLIRMNYDEMKKILIKHSKQTKQATVIMHSNIHACNTVESNSPNKQNRQQLLCKVRNTLLILWNQTFQTNKANYSYYVKSETRL